MQLYNFLLIPAFHICNLFFVSCYSVAYITLENQSCGLNIKLTVTDTLHCNISIVFLHERCNSVTLNLKEKQVNSTAYVKVKNYYEQKARKLHDGLTNMIMIFHYIFYSMIFSAQAKTNLKQRFCNDLLESPCWSLKVCICEYF